MKNKNKTKEQVINELRELRRKNTLLELLVTKLKKVDEKLRKSEERYRSLVESTEDSIYLVDKNYRYIFMNKKHMKRMSLLKKQFLGKHYSEFHSPVETKWFVEKVKHVFETGVSVQHEHRSLRDGRYFLRTLSPVRETDGKISVVTVVSKDITELKRMEEKLHALSITDELTGVYNRRGFFALAEHLLKIAKRTKKGLFLLYADVDGLKEINDSMGHQEGDMMLIEVANVLKGNYRESDIIARIGGDEFVVLPVGATGDSKDIIISRLEEALEMHNSQRKRAYKLSLSYGLAYYDPNAPCSLDEFLIQADKAMYEHKKRKRLS